MRFDCIGRPRFMPATPLCSLSVEPSGTFRWRNFPGTFYESSADTAEPVAPLVRSHRIECFSHHICGWISECSRGRDSSTLLLYAFCTLDLGHSEAWEVHMMENGALFRRSDVGVSRAYDLGYNHAIRTQLSVCL
jgi:hypothetical protein